jgi:alkylation response protein AidB-like acyl-CoA dehydrogenase
VNFDDAPEDAAWRAECAEWIGDHLARIDDIGGNPVERAKRWQAMKFDAGLAKIAWPPQEGGRNGTALQQIIFDQEQARHRTPPNILQIGLDLIAPTIRAHGTDAQRAVHLRAALRGEHIWCQMFSEPGAGSDVAGLATSAVRDGDEWVLNGQKVWTTNAHLADYGEVLCRTNPDAPKHRGITAFILDLRTPGVTIRPLEQITGTSEFNEIFLDDVRVPHENLLGAEGDGWHVAVTTLMNERKTMGAGGAGRRSSTPTRLADLATRTGNLDAVARQRIVDIHTRSELLRFLGFRTLTAAMQGRRPGPEGSVAKLASAKLNVDTGDLAMSLLGADAMAADPDDARWVTRFLWGPGHRLGGGTDEVNRNIVAERVLGLPGEPRDDDSLPWSDIPRTVR